MAAASTGPATSAAQQAAFEALVAERPEAVQALARRARALIVELMPEVTESIWAQQGTASYGVGPKKMSEHFAYFTLAKAHLGFGFYYGADLADPDGLLEGSGKAMRRVKIDAVAQLESEAMRDLVREASGHLPKLKRG